MLERKKPEIGEVRNGLAGGVDAEDSAGVPDLLSGGVHRKHQLQYRRVTPRSGTPGQSPFAALPSRRCEHGSVSPSSSAAIYGFDLTTGETQWHVDRALTSPFYQFKSLGEPTTIGTGATARVVMSEFEIYFNPQNPAMVAADGLTRWIEPATGIVAASITEGSGTAPPEVDRWVYYPRERSTIGIHATQSHMVIADAPGVDQDFTVSLPNAGITDVVSDGSTTFAADSGVTFAMPAKGCGQASCPTSWSTSLAGHLTVVNGTLFGVDANGSLGAVPSAGCGSAVCLPEWTAPLTGAPLGLAVTGTRVFATSGNTLAAFSAGGCGAATCGPLWSSTTGARLTAPSVVNDLVFTGGDAGRVQGWRATGCGSATCDPIASLPQGSSVGNVTPISRALVFVVDGNLRKLMLPD